MSGRFSSALRARRRCWARARRWAARGSRTTAPTGPAAWCAATTRWSSCACHGTPLPTRRPPSWRWTCARTATPRRGWSSARTISRTAWTSTTSAGAGTPAWSAWRPWLSRPPDVLGLNALPGGGPGPPAPPPGAPVPRRGLRCPPSDPVPPAEDPVEDRGEDDDQQRRGPEPRHVPEPGIRDVLPVEPGDGCRHRDDRSPARDLLHD